jgi:hypothetical protein
MAEALQGIFIDPPIAVARLGGSTVPQDAYLWIESPDPRSDGETTLMPTWSLTVLPDGSVEPTQPTELRFRDGALIRPVCPFFEIRALLGEPGSLPQTWHDVPLTPALLTRHGASLVNLKLRINAQNLKAARRTRNPALGFGTFPPVEIVADDHNSKTLLGVSPPGAKPPMIPKARSIPIGAVQIMRSKPNQPGALASGIVDMEVIRFRFSSARGRFYGPPQALQTTPRLPFPAVDSANAFLDAKAGWFGAAMTGIVQPSDTYDGAERNDQEGPSLGVVDDTCEARIEAILTLPGGATPLRAAANVLVGPPDFGPDRRPFLSLADELNDRSGDAAARDAAMTAEERDAWVEDLFERVYETVSLFNLDHYREERGITLTGNRLAPPLANDGVAPATHAMGSRDALRNPRYTVESASANEQLPLSKHARRQHRALADLQSLRDFITLNPGRIQTLVRRAFEVERGENFDRSTMRMPPFMRQSNALPLTLSNWQYDLLMQWVAAEEAASPGVAALVSTGAAPSPTSATVQRAADERRNAVLARLDAGGSDVA